MGQRGEAGSAALRNYRFSGLQGYLLIKSLRGFLSPCLHSQVGLPKAIWCLSGLLLLSVLSDPRSAALNDGIWYGKTDKSNSRIRESREKRRVSHPICCNAKTRKLKIPSARDSEREGMGVSRPQITGVLGSSWGTPRGLIHQGCEKDAMWRTCAMRGPPIAP